VLDSLTILTLGDGMRVLIVTLVVQVMGLLWYGPLFADLYVQLSFGSMAAYRRLVSKSPLGLFSYRRVMTGAWIGSLILVAALQDIQLRRGLPSAGANLVEGTPQASRVGTPQANVLIESPQAAILLGLLVGLVLLGGSLLHEPWSGSSLGVLLLNGAFNCLAFPLASLLLFVLTPVFP